MGNHTLAGSLTQVSLATHEGLHVTGQERIIAAAVLALALSGCSTNDRSSAESVASAQAAFSAKSCAATDADVRFKGEIDPAWVTPVGYNNCYRGYVVDLWNLAEEYAGAGQLRIDWADEAITDSAECKGSSVAGLFYVWTDIFVTTGSSSTSTTAGTSTVSSVGIGGTYEGWSLFAEERVGGDWLKGRCVFGKVLASGLGAGKGYRIAATARNPGNQVRKVSISTYAPSGLEE